MSTFPGPTQHSELLSDAVKRGHREIFEDYENYTNASNVDTQARWARQLVWEVARHSVGEELIVYPLFEKHLGQAGLEMAEKDRAEHQEVKYLLAEFENLRAGSTEYYQNLNEVIAALRKHTEGEEAHDLPQLEAALGPEASQSEAARFMRTKKFAPTRAHPHAPDKPPFETVAGLLAAPLDKLKDLFSKFPSEEPKNL